jgi:hypothetical protein
MSHPIRILLQTTIPTIDDHWNIARFSLLCSCLAGLRDENGEPLVEVTARDRGPLGKPDPVLSILDRSDFDELWLFGVDSGDGLDSADCAAIARFHLAGGGLLVTRGHDDIGSSVQLLDGVGKAHYFHAHNFHSGAHGDYQEVTLIVNGHDLFIDPDNGEVLRHLPADPHEGAIQAPLDDPSAHVIATGRSKITGRSFNLVVAFEPSGMGGRAVAQSSFHHFVDYNWDPRMGAPSFLSEPASDAMVRFPEARRSTERYVQNLALWLAGRAVDPEKRRLDEALDAALEGTFPASDPIALSG